MATRTATLAPTNSSNANYSAWVNEIAAALIAYGWIKSTETGSTTFGGTLTAPSGTNTYPDWAIWRMDDATQSTAAVYMRIDFGEGATTDCPSIKLQLCIGSTNGAGTLTGVLSTQITTTTTQAASASTFTCYSSGSTSRFQMHFWSNTQSGHGWTMSVERDHDTSGADTALGLNIALVYASTASAVVKSTQYISANGNIGSQDACWYAMVSNQTTQASGGIVGIGHVRCHLGPMRNPMIGLFVCARADFTMAATTTASIYGSSHTYMMLRANSGGTTVLLNLVNSDSAIGMRYE